MKTFKIAHLYYDLMNLYGENGNLRYLKKRLEEQGLDVSIEFLSIDDKIDFKDARFSISLLFIKLLLFLIHY